MIRNGDLLVAYHTNPLEFARVFIRWFPPSLAVLDSAHAGRTQNEARFRRPQIHLRLHQLNSDGRNSVIPGTNVTNSKAMTITR